METVRKLRRRAIPALLLPLAITTIGFLSFRTQAAPASAAYTEAGPRECPETWADTTDTVPGIVTNMNIPEFNDCQRFIWDKNGTLSYDSLYAIFAVDDIRRAWLQLSADSLNAPPPGRLVAIIYTFGGPSDLPNGDPSKGGTYQSLFIDKGWNCLYLYQRKDTLRARMEQNGPDNNYCSPWFDPRQPSAKPHQDLSVRRAPVRKGFTEKDVPPVARWDWDPGQRRQYIGIYCGAAWCEVGGAGSPSHKYAPELGISVRQRRIAEIKGWYDEQRLAVGDPLNPHPGDVWGTIYPAARLGDLTETHFNGTWVPVSYVAVSSDYTSKMIFERTAAQGPPAQPGVPASPSVPAVNIIEFCKGFLGNGTGGTCKAPAEFTATPPCYPTGLTAYSPPYSPPWWRRVRKKSGVIELKPLCLKRWDHSTMPGNPIIPGTVRWRWIASDEMSWGRCGGGCCQ